MNIEDIPNIPDRDERFAAITVDCYDEYEQLSAFEVYLTDALRPLRRCLGPRAPVTVLGPGVNATVLDDYRVFVSQGERWS